jgi:hypothetical protein
MELLRKLEQLLNKDNKKIRSTKELRRGQIAHTVFSCLGEETSSAGSLNFAYPSDDSDFSSIHFNPAGDSKHHDFSDFIYGLCNKRKTSSKK